MGYCAIKKNKKTKNLWLATEYCFVSLSFPCPTVLLYHFPNQLLPPTSYYILPFAHNQQVWKNLD